MSDKFLDKCHRCVERHSGCHAGCLDYVCWSITKERENDRIKQKKDEDRIIESFALDTDTRIKKYRKQHYRKGMR